MVIIEAFELDRIIIYFFERGVESEQLFLWIDLNF